MYGGLVPAAYRSVLDAPTAGEIRARGRAVKLVEECEYCGEVVEESMRGTGVCENCYDGLWEEAGENLAAWEADRLEEKE